MKSCIVITSLLLLAGCATLQKGADPVAVKAEQSESIALAVIDQALLFEYTNREQVPQAVQDVASRVRKEAPKAFVSLDRVRVAYKVGGTDAATLLKALNVVDALVGEVKWWTADSAKAGLAGYEIDLIVAEANANKDASQSWVAALPLFIDLGKSVYSLVLDVKASLSQNAAWTAIEDEAFRKRLLNTITQDHWRSK